MRISLCGGFQNLCTTLKNLEKDEQEKLAIKVNLVTSVAEVQCFLKDMQEFYQVSQIGTRVSDNSMLKL